MEQTFEQKIGELEEILKAFENKDLELDRSLELYEKGIRLIRECTKALEEAQKKVEEINARE
ncbi:MAG: exodeoxyribonuclease VII small subunit [Clostridia bacterium]|nr:exodeoxyribonuclease VII small subunit [Clostridia bacterium]MBQ4455001.1 exodeoxyribonuclease VII small subunit [Clostridia bacterium]MBQ5956434.1 exodeoxyribonuclease VII small subunit [Clostridia bacterium]MBQ6003124.1 exodeoxyribonuclease VII small subunit [Clostridia bacterium]MBR0438273.1 exodeoxyribonuclease VII small subunit [Clostridia bacterium]